MIATHNSATYLRPRTWWQRALSWMARCQDITISEQYRLGTRVFDFRIRMYGNEPRIAHGLVEYKGDIHAILAWLDEKAKASGETVWVTLVNEDTLKSSDPAYFGKFGRICEKNYKNLDFELVSSKKTWTMMKYFTKAGWTRSFPMFWRFTKSRPLPWPRLWYKIDEDENLEVLDREGDSTDSLVWVDFL